VWGRCVRDPTVRWIDRPPPRSTNDDDDDEDGLSEVWRVDGSERFEFTLKRYWRNVTVMSLQCVLRACRVSVSTITDTPAQSTPAVTTLSYWPL